MKTQRNELSSIKITSGSRTYYFNIKISVEGTKYLVIKELKNDEKKGQIMIFREYIQDFQKGFKKSLKLMKKGKSKAYDLDQLRRVYPKAYAGWTKEEEDKLKILYSRNKTINELVDIFQRKPGAIHSRLKKLIK
jgi:hypothetical protein